MSEVFQNLFDNYENNCKNAELESVNYIANKEYPIVSLFSVLTKEQIIMILKNKRFAIGLTRYERCLFITLWLDAISCILNNTCNFATRTETLQIVKMLLDTIRIYFSMLQDTDCSPNQHESLINLIRCSENRLQNTSYFNYFAGITNFCQNVLKRHFQNNDNFKENKTVNNSQHTDVDIANKEVEVICVDSAIKRTEVECVNNVPSDKKKGQKSILNYFGKKEKITTTESNVNNGAKATIDFSITIDNNIAVPKTPNTSVKNAFGEIMKKMNTRKVLEENTNV